MLLRSLVDRSTYAVITQASHEISDAEPGSQLHWYMVYLHLVVFQIMRADPVDSIETAQ